ncbi:hypothetical protein N0B51_13870 [Tsuneonella sp. YG55]|uniref:Peptidase M10 metallopeptidase domain-containing protein n=1 Tax=Tsuneonella litorea TaxID=2976475 RepID=A0A9X2W4U1_9SPHN|nr:hypothetical protein [Tsuneonella litorea]MCT2560065.1 hypothetical protein [Tsuneonella litorea]
MKPHIVLFASGAMVAIGLPSVASADVMPYKMSTNTNGFEILLAMPEAGDAPTLRAAQTWTDVGSKLVFSYTGLGRTEDTAQNPSLDRTGVQIQPKVTSFYAGSPDWAGLTYRTASSATTTSDADIVINADKIAAGSFYYGTGTPPSNQNDYESVVVHEFGHVAGFDHDDNLTPYCVMVSKLYGNWVARTPCTSERATLRSKYGVR